jgi:hypothetical protein
MLARLTIVIKQRKEAGLNQVSWRGNRGLHIEIKNQYEFSIWLPDCPYEVGPKSNWKSLKIDPNVKKNLKY